MDSRISEYAPFDLEFGRKSAERLHWGKLVISRTWGKSIIRDEFDLSLSLLCPSSSDYHWVYSRSFSTSSYTSDNYLFYLKVRTSPFLSHDNNDEILSEVVVVITVINII